MNVNELFIISIQRSGSNWLHRCLNEHDEIKINGELNVSMMLKKLDEIVAGDNEAEKKLKDTGAYKRAAQNYIRLLMEVNADIVEGDNCTYLVDKSAYPCITSLRDKPEQVAYARVLEEYFPRAKKILIVRNARDVVVSFSEWKKQSIGSLLKPTPRSLVFFMRHLKNWCTLHENWLDNIEQNENWLVINYEDMKSDFSGTLSCVFDFLALETDETFITELTSKLYGIDNPVYQKENKERGYSFFRKGAVGEWEEKYAWWHKLLYKICYEKRVNAIYERIETINK